MYYLYIMVFILMFMEVHLLFTPTKLAYPCLVYAKEQDTWLNINTRSDISASNVDEVWWLAKSPRSEIQTK